MRLIYHENDVRKEMQVKVLSMVEGHLYCVDMNDNYVSLEGLNTFTVGE